MAALENGNLQLAARFFAAIENNDIATVEEIYAPDALIWHNYDPVEARLDGTLAQGVQENLALLSALPGLIKDLHYEPWYERTTDTGFVRQHLVNGRTPDGQPVSFPVCAIGEVEDGRISAFYEYLDVTQLPQAILEYFAQQ